MIYHKVYCRSVSIITSYNLMYTQYYTMYLPTSQCFFFLYSFIKISIHRYYYNDNNFYITTILYLIDGLHEIRAETPYFQTHLSKSFRDETTVGNPPWVGHTSVIVSYICTVLDRLHTYCWVKTSEQGSTKNISI